MPMKTYMDCWIIVLKTASYIWLIWFVFIINGSEYKRFTMDYNLVNV